MTNSSEYNTLISNTAELALAVRPNLISLSEAMQAARLISLDNASELRNVQHIEAQRAARLVELLLIKVQLNPQHFYTFLEVLQRDQDQYADILRKVWQTHRSHQNPSRPFCHKETDLKKENTQVKQTEFTSSQTGKQKNSQGAQVRVKCKMSAIR